MTGSAAQARRGGVAEPGRARQGSVVVEVTTQHSFCPPDTHTPLPKQHTRTRTYPPTTICPRTLALWDREQGQWQQHRSPPWWPLPGTLRLATLTSHSAVVTVSEEAEAEAAKPGIGSSPVLSPAQSPRTREPVGSHMELDYAMFNVNAGRNVHGRCMV
jgi:hypothetical protein